MKILNEKNREFCEEYVKNGYNGTKAYAKVYGQENENHSAVGASQLLKQQKIRDYLDIVEGSFRLLGQREGLDKASLIKLLKEMMYASKKDVKWVETPDWSARTNGINIYAKLAGFETDSKDPKGWLMEEDKDKEIVDLSQMTEEERKIYRTKLLETL